MASGVGHRRARGVVRGARGEAQGRAVPRAARRHERGAGRRPSWFSPPVERTSARAGAARGGGRGHRGGADARSPTTRLSEALPSSACGSPSSPCSRARLRRSPRSRLRSLGDRRGAAVRLLDLGDSLSVGTAPYLRARLRAYRIWKVHDVGLHAYDAAERPRPGPSPPSRGRRGQRRHERRPAPGRGVRARGRAASSRLRAASAASSGRRSRGRRPSARRYAGLNRSLARAARRHANLVLVDWVGMVRRHPRWLSDDGVHVSAAGYRARAAAIAAAVKTRCARG